MAETPTADGGTIETVPAPAPGGPTEQPVGTATNARNEINTTLIEQAIHERVNESRTDRGLEQLAFAEWAPSETRGYQGLLLDRLTDEPRGVEIPMYSNANQDRVPVGNAFIIDQTSSCSDDFIGVQLEDAPVSRFEPDYDTFENPLVGDEPGPPSLPFRRRRPRHRANLALEPEWHWWGRALPRCSNDSSVVPRSNLS